MKLHSLIILLLTITISTVSIGQTTDPVQPANSYKAVNDTWQPSLRKDGVIDRVPHNNYLTPWQPIRETDVLWKKRVWREIDTRQKQNYPFRYPGDEYSGGGMYIEIVLNAIKTGKITAFSDERFTIPLSYEDIQKSLVGEPDTIYVEDPITGQLEMRIIQKEFNPDNVTKFRLKEDWIFDRKVGRMVCRILGVSPFMDKYSPESNIYQGSFPMFWVYYPDIREAHVKYEVYNPENDVFRMTWDDFFEKRMFSSFVVKSTFNNPSMNDIKSYKEGIYRLYESEKIKETIFNKEHDLWVY